MFYLDTNTCIYFLNGKYDKVRENILATKPSDIRIPSIVKAELLYGAYKSTNKERNLEKIKSFLSVFQIEDFSGEMAEKYGMIRTNLELSGQIIGPNDLLIAATVLNKKGILVTNNIKEFSRVETLDIIDWTV